MSRRQLLQRSFRIILKVLARVEVQGGEHIPAEGPCLVTFNHLGMVDAALLFCYVPRQDFTGLVADKHQQNAFLRWLVNFLNGIWIDRERADFKALKAAQRYLAGGGMLAVSPEGTRSPTGALIPAKEGVAFLADRLGVPVLPIAITGTPAGLGRMFRLQRPAFGLRFGEPFELSPIDRREREASMRRNTDEIMCRIAALLPPEYRGVYTNHPRLKELLSEAAQ
ncbi:MAG: 1-acyl-sn-glycerol-3-phosphate acyltransferase [Anaerolineales bacterium]|nr:1-acyl-sn-glycerol-3-phosphate acyltransferase [Anaerolineales bacterium]